MPVYYNRKLPEMSNDYSLSASGAGRGVLFEIKGYWFKMPAVGLFADNPVKLEATMFLPVGSVINAMAVVAGGAVGAFLGSRMPIRLKDILFQAMGLTVIVMGMKLAIGYQDVFLLTLSIVLGGATGALIGLHERLEAFAAKMENRFSRGNEDSSFTAAFITGTSVFCVGSLAVLGSVEEGVSGSFSLLLVKALMDGIIAINIGSTQGRGVMLSALPLFVYQGTLTLLAGFLQPFLQGDVLVEFTAVGGVLIAGVGANLIFPDRLKVLNLLPAMFWVCMLFPLFH